VEAPRDVAADATPSADGVEVELFESGVWPEGEILFVSLHCQIEIAKVESRSRTKKT
jgi:hypothetical protein